MSEIYNEEYFNWQKIVGEFGGKANLFKFKDHIQPSDTILDFGCGGGYLLKNVTCAKKIGIEINPLAAKIARENNVDCFSTLDDIRDASIDIVISNHALEHVQNPYGTLISLHRKLAANGMLVIVVPCEATTKAYDKNDINQHIYTWNPQLLGNLASQAGFSVVTVDPIYHKWPEKYLQIQKRYGWNIFHFVAKINGRIKKNDFQVKLVAKKIDH